MGIKQSFSDEVQKDLSEDLDMAIVEYKDYSINDLEEEKEILIFKAREAREVFDDIVKVAELRNRLTYIGHVAQIKTTKERLHEYKEAVKVHESLLIRLEKNHEEFLDEWLEDFNE